jgi:hypothetical protein
MRRVARRDGADLAMAVGQRRIELSMRMAELERSGV